MNVLLFTNLFPNRVEPDRGNFVALMARKMIGKAHVEVVSPLPWFPKLSILRKMPRFTVWLSHAEIPDRDTFGEVDVHYPKYYFLPKIGFPFQPLSIFLSSFGLLRSLRDAGHLDMISAHWIFPDAVAAVYMAKKLDIPCVISARGCDINRYSSSFLRRIQIGWALRNADAITVVSNALEEKIVETYGIARSKITFIPNGVDESIFHPRDRRQCLADLGLDDQKKKLLFVGQLHPVKDVETLLRALAILKRKDELSFETLLVGDGPLREQLHTLAEELGLDPADVSFLGQLPHEDVARYFGAADLFCLPSIREGRPNVVIEALASGLPVVASRVGGIPELVNDRNGMLVEASSPLELAAALATSMNREWDRDEIARSQSNCSWDACADHYLKLFNDVRRSYARSNQTLGISGKN